ncbi:MAG: GFA family protein [Pelagimonas sp.]|jgi:hypothetical protein|nr:GFA family protein [Pelagimonas sp.]
MTATKPIKGTCACGAVHFETSAQPVKASCCHCTQCRQMSGHFWSSAQVPDTELTITGPVKWVTLSPKAQRGICPDCGAFLFWHGTGEDMISFALGALAQPHDITLEKHIFTAEKGSHYEICDDLPQFP